MSTIEELQKKIKELNEQLEAEIEKRKDVECPFKKNERYFVLYSDGSFESDCWEDHDCEHDWWSQGNIFKTEREAKLERDRRALLAKFKRFKDKCNGDWKPDWNNIHEGRYHIHLYPNKSECSIGQDVFQDSMPQFGRFKNVDDCLRAIELFGDEIIRLWVEE